MSLRHTMYKIQMALCQKGKKIKINQFQAYSERAGRMVTRYVLIEKRKTEDKFTGDIIEKDFVIFESYQTAEVVKKLAELYRGDR